MGKGNAARIARMQMTENSEWGRKLCPNGHKGPRRTKWLRQSKTKICEALTKKTKEGKGITWIKEV